MRLVRVTKKAGEIRPVLVDWTDILPETTDTAIVASSWALESGDVTIADATATPTATFCRVSGGTADKPWILVNTIMTSLGHRLVCRVRGFTEVGSAAATTTPMIYYGVGVAGRTDLTGLLTAADIALPFEFVVSPAGQKIYAGVPEIMGAPAMFFGLYEVDCTSSSVVLDGVTYTLLESTDLHTWTSLVVTIAGAV